MKGIIIPVRWYVYCVAAQTRSLCISMTCILFFCCQHMTFLQTKWQWIIRDIYHSDMRGRLASASHDILDPFHPMPINRLMQSIHWGIALSAPTFTSINWWNIRGLTQTLLSKSDTFVKVPDIQIEEQLPTPMSVCWRKYSKPTLNLGYGPLTRYVKLRVAHAPGMPVTFSPPPTSKENHYLWIPACITARASRKCRDACRDRKPVVAGKTFPAFPAHAQPAILRIWQEAHWGIITQLHKTMDVITQPYL